MAKVVVTKSLLDSLAQHINAKAGTTGAKTIAQMQATVDGISTKMSVTWHQCPEAVRNYRANVTYDPSDYSNSQIANFAPATPVASNTKPIGKTVGGVTYYNDVPNVETPFSADSAAGTLKPLDALRWINAEADSQGNSFCPNMRDLGGWPCDGGKVRYGLLFRCGQPTIYARSVLVDQLRIQRELDLQGQDLTRTTSVMGTDIDYCRPPRYQWYTIADKAIWKEILTFLFDGAKYGRPTIFHCSAGADRTGTVACIVEALLGVSQSNIDKDYELTSFFTGTDTDLHARRRNESEWFGLINQINALPGSTFRDKVVGWVATMGFTAEEINAFRTAMIDGTPETVTPSIDTYTVTNTLANASSDNSAASATEYQPYTAKITPASGYAISSVQVKMGGVDVTSSAWVGTQTVLRRKIMSSLMHCTSDNSKVAVIDGQGYAATLTATDGYTLDGASATILMGGIDVSTYYKDGIIAIPNVTGDLEITVTAVESAPPYTNLLDTASADWITNKRYNSSGAVVDAPGWDTSNYVACTKDDVLRFKNMDIAASYGGANNGRLMLFDSSKAYVVGVNAHNETQYFTTDAAGVTTVDLSGYPATYLNRMAYVRFVCAQDAYSSPIATINEEIT
nr:MAG TPA: tyrosine phosphatase family protein [Caudoviricetes sp.]